MFKIARASYDQECQSRRRSQARQHSAFVIRLAKSQSCGRWGEHSPLICRTNWRANILELITACAFTQCDLQGVAGQLSRYDWRLRAHYLNRTMRARC
jgi:hypothetical protein